MDLLIALFLFVLAIEMMKRGGDAVAEGLRGNVLTGNAVSTLGTGQLLAYLFLSGKPVAAFALALFAHGALTRLEAFTMLSGGRLGAAFIVLLVGFIYSLRSPNRREPIGVGVVALALTAVVYLPGMLLGYWFLRAGLLNHVRITLGGFEGVVAAVWGPVVDLLDRFLPGAFLLPLGGILIIAAIKVLDRALPPIDGSGRRGSRRVRRPWAMFVLGFGVTLVTFSVSVALTVLVPLAARGLVRREEAIPYIMGANVATLADTLLVAVLIGDPVGVQIVLAEALAVALVTAVLLAAAYRPLARAVVGFDDWVVGSRRRLGIFVAGLLAFPLVLLVVGGVLGRG
jgi:Na+/phosphate symporter